MLNQQYRNLNSHIFPAYGDNEKGITKGKEFFWNGTKVDIFPTLIKTRSFLISAVLKQFSQEEREYLDVFYMIPSEKVEENEIGISHFLKMFSKAEEDKERENALFYQTIASGLHLYAKKTKTKRDLKSIHFYRLLTEGSAFYIENEKNEGEGQAQICLYELLMLTKSVSLKEPSHPYTKRTKEFQKDYLLLLSAFSCREQSISSFQILYLEKIAREFQLSGTEFSKTLQVSLCYDPQERKELVKSIVKNHDLQEAGQGEISLTDCLLLEKLRFTRELKEDKLQIEKILCKNKQARKELEEKNEFLLKELTL